MRVPLLDLKAQYAVLKEEMDEAIRKVIDDQQFIRGPVVTSFEDQICGKLKCKNAIGVSSGSDALLVALMSLGVGPGDSVITTPYSFFATIGAILRLHATPIFIDIYEDTFNINENLLEAWIAKQSPRDLARIKAILPVHLFGQCANMQEILRISKDFNIPIVEDSAQSIGATVPINGEVKTSGTIGDMGCFSFFPSKNLGAFGDGGMVVTDSDELAEKIRILSNHGAHPKYIHGQVGGNFRLDALQAAVLSVKLKHLDQWTSARRSVASKYNDELSEKISLPFMKWGAEHHVFNQYVIRHSRRDELQEFLNSKGIGNQVYYPLSLHRQECLSREGIKINDDFPVSDKCAKTSLAIPMYPELNDEEQNFIIEKINEFCNA